MSDDRLWWIHVQQYCSTGFNIFLSFIMHLHLADNCSNWHTMKNGMLRMLQINQFKNPEHSKTKCTSLKCQIINSVTRLGAILPLGLLRLLFTQPIFTKPSVSTHGLLSRFQKWLDVDVLIFKIKIFMLIYWHILATFSEHLAKFYSIIWSH